MIIILLVFSLLSSKISFCMENQYPSLPDDFRLALTNVAMRHEFLLFDDLGLALVGLESAEAISAKAQPSQIKPVPGQFVMPSKPKPIPKKHLDGLPPARVLPPAPQPTPSPLKRNILSAEDKEKIASIEETFNKLIQETPKKEYHCAYCGLFFIPTKKNPDYFILHSLKGRYKCHLKTHRRNLLNRMEYKQKHHSCETCDKKFSTHAILGFHRKTCSQLKQK